jgi:hypothetical protein
LELRSLLETIKLNIQNNDSVFTLNTNVSQAALPMPVKPDLKWGQLLKDIDKQMDAIANKIFTLNTHNISEINKQKSDVSDIINGIDDTQKNLSNNIKTISDHAELIRKYYNDNSFIFEKIFFSEKSFPTEMINMGKLRETQPNITDNINEILLKNMKELQQQSVQQLSEIAEQKKQIINTMIKPDFPKLNDFLFDKGLIKGGSANKVTEITAAQPNIIKQIYDIWMKKKSKNVETKYKSSQKTIDDKIANLQKSELKKLQVKFEKLNNLVKNIRDPKTIKSIHKYYKGVDQIVNNINKKINLIIKANKYQKTASSNDSSIDFINRYNVSLEDNINDVTKNIRDLINNIDIKYNDVYVKYIKSYSVQTGGVADITETLLQLQNEFIILATKVLQYKKDFVLLNEKIHEYNVLYAQFYSHQQFISNYMTLIIKQENQKMYHNISKGTVDYYYKLLKKLADLIDNPIERTNPIIMYFYMYHFVTINFLKNFLKKLYESWLQLQLTPNFRFLIMNDKNEFNHFSSKIRLGFFILNLFVDIMDNYQSIAGSSVGVYLRINDQLEQTTYSFFAPNNERLSGKLDINKMFKCNKQDVKTIQNTDQEMKNEFPVWVNEFNKIKFNNIFDKAEFPDNNTLAKYMALPNTLSKGKSIVLMTYGYSGVGKTFTMFGGGLGSPGVLQTTLQTISGSEFICMRTYEIYGTAMPYNSYWQKIYEDAAEKRKMPAYNHVLYSYTRKDDTMNIYMQKIDNPEQIKQYLDLIKAEASEGYSVINDDFISKFNIFTAAVDTIRTKEGRIKATVNNPQSSRSIMVYEFKIKLQQQQKLVKLVIIDLPGKENISSSYVHTGMKNDDMNNQELGLKLMDHIINYDPSIFYDNPASYPQQNPQTLNLTAVRAGLFLNPILMCIFPHIAKMFNEFIEEPTNNFNKIGITLHYIDTAVKGGKTVLRENKEISLSISSKRSEIKDKDTYDNYPFSLPFSKLNLHCQQALSYYNQILTLNKIDIIIKFINEVLIEHNEQSNTRQKNTGALPFEGFYINENILGLTMLLKERLKQTSNESDLVKPFYSPIMINATTTDDFRKIYRNEQIALLFYIRDLVRSDLVQPDLQKKHLFNINCSTNLIDSNNDFYEKVIYTKGDSSITIKDVFEASYDFNKRFTNNPPIKTFMDAYFGDDDEGKPVIDNFYLFYVVQNESLMDDGSVNESSAGKCANQIKLIYDSRDLIQAIENYGKKEKST